MENNNSEHHLLSNKYLFLKRNSSSLLSTSSSLRGKKIKLRNEFSPFSKLERRSLNKKLLDFPICISIFANNLSINENDININLNPKPKLNLKFADISNNSIKFNKKIISRNHNSFLFNSLSPKNSSKQISNFSKFQSSGIKKNSKPFINKINYMPLFKSTKQDFLIKNKKNEITTSFDQDLSTISPKNPSNNINNTNSNKSKIIIYSTRTSVSSQQENISKNNISKNISQKNLYKLNNINVNKKNIMIKEFNNLFNENDSKKSESFLSSNNNNYKDKIKDNLLLSNNVKEKNENISFIKKKQFNY